MANTITIKRGLKANISSLILQPGELAIALDTQELYIGDNTGATKPVNVGIKRILASSKEEALTLSQANPDNIYY